METCETILVKGQDGNPLRINATDFKVGTHELCDDADAAKVETGGNGSSDANNAGNTPGQQQPNQGQPAPRGAAKPAA